MATAPIRYDVTMSERTNFTLNLGRIHKSELVSQFGIGEDMPPIILGWTDDDKKVVCSLRAGLHSARKLEAIIIAVVAMRRMSPITHVTMCIDAFWAPTQNEVDLRKRFADGDPEAREALAIISVGSDDPYFIAAPYQMGLGRVVDFDTQLHKIPLLPEDAYVVGIQRGLAAPDGPLMSVADLARLGVRMESVE